MRAAAAPLLCALALVACGPRAPAPPPLARHRLELRHVTARDALVDLAHTVGTPLVVDGGDATARIECSYVTATSAGVLPDDELVALVADALRPSGLSLVRAGGALRVHLIAGVPAPPECGGAHGMLVQMPSLPPAPPPPAPPELDDAAAARIAAGIRGGGPGEYRVSSEAAALLRDAQSQMMREVRVVPYAEGGRVVGLRLFGIRQSSALAALGFQNGDTVKTVNGRPLASPDAALEAYAMLRGATDVRVELERRGAPTVLHYTVGD